MRFIQPRRRCRRNKKKIYTLLQCFVVYCCYNTDEGDFSRVFQNLRLSSSCDYAEQRNAHSHNKTHSSPVDLHNHCYYCSCFNLLLDSALPRICGLRCLHSSLVRSRRARTLPSILKCDSTLSCAETANRVEGRNADCRI